MQLIDTDTVNLVEELELLENTRQNLESQIEDAQLSIQEAKANKNLTGEYINPVDFNNYKTTVRTKTSELHIVNRKIKMFRLQLSKPDMKATYFYEAAKQHLDPEDFVAISHKAEELMF